MIDGHYVYVHCRPDGTPFYVGKGQGKRAYKFGQRRQWHAHVVAKYGAENIIVAIYPQLSESQAFAFEISLLAGFHRAGFALVNLTSGGEGATGRKHRAESIEKMRQVQKGKIISPEARRKMAQAKLGRPWSEAMRVKMVGRKRSPEVVAKVVAKTKGLKRTPEQIARMVEGRRLAGGWKHSEESKAKMREGHKGKQLTAEHRAKIGLASKLHQQTLKEKQAHAT